MEFVVLTETIIKKLVTEVDAVSVRELETTEDNLVQIEVMVSANDLGKVIGKNGRTIQSIRNIVQASAAINGEKRVRIEVDSY